MKLLFTADWHIKLTSKQIPYEFQWNRFILLFDLILEQLKYHDALVIGGDLFDTEPNSDEIALFLNFYSKKALLHSSKPVYIFAGNHDLYSKKKVSFLKKLLKPLVEVTYIDEFTSTKYFDILPYQHLTNIANFTPKNKLLLTHVRGDILPHVKAEIDLDLFNHWDLVAAGDLHDISNSQRNIVYPGSPLTTHYNKSIVKKGFLSINCSDLTYKFVELEIPQLIRLELESEADVFEEAFHHYEFIIKGTQSELSKVTSSKVKKKLTTQEKTTSTLNLSNTSSIYEELEAYFGTVLRFEQHKIEEIMNLFDRGLDAQD